MLISTPSAEKVSSSIWFSRLAVHRIGEVGTEFLQVDLVDAAPDFLIGREQDLDRPVPDIRIVDEDLGRGHDLSQSRLVVGAEQCRSIGRDDVVADLVLQFRMIADADHPARVAGKIDIPAGIIPDDLRLHIRAAEIGRRIHVRAETDDRHRLVAIGRNGRVDIGVFIETCVRKTDLQQFIDQNPSEILLLAGGRLRRRGGVGLRIDNDITEKAVENSVGHSIHSSSKITQRI